MNIDSAVHRAALGPELASGPFELRSSGQSDGSGSSDPTSFADLRCSAQPSSFLLALRTSALRSRSLALVSRPSGPNSRPLRPGFLGSRLIRQAPHTSVRRRVQPGLPGGCCPLGGGSSSPRARHDGFAECPLGGTRLKQLNSRTPDGSDATAHLPAPFAGSQLPARPTELHLGEVGWSASSEADRELHPDLVVFGQRGSDREPASAGTRPHDVNPSGGCPP